MLYGGRFERTYNGQAQWSASAEGVAGEIQRKILPSGEAAEQVCSSDLLKGCDRCRSGAPAGFEAWAEKSCLNPVTPFQPADSPAHAMACPNQPIFARFLMMSSTTAGSARVDVSPSWSMSLLATLRRMRRMILPDLVLGKPGAN